MNCIKMFNVASSILVFYAIFVTLIMIKHKHMLIFSLFHLTKHTFGFVFDTVECIILTCTACEQHQSLESSQYYGQCGLYS